MAAPSKRLRNKKTFSARTVEISVHFRLKKKLTYPFDSEPFMTNKLLEPELLSVFCTVCESKQLNLAAKKLGITTSAVSQALKKLETQLKTDLFYHHQRPLKLTPAGKKLLSEGQPIIDALKALQTQYLDIDMPQVSLRLGLSESATATLSPWLVSAIHKRIAQLSVNSNLNTILTEELKNGCLDICIYSEGLLTQSQWMRIPIFEEEFLFVRAASLPALHTIEDLRAIATVYPYISYTNASQDRETVDQFLHSVNVRPRSRIQTSSSYCLVGLIEQARGWTLLPATNLLSGGTFAHAVKWTPLPKQYRFRRRTWVLGNPSFANEIRWLANLSQTIYGKHITEQLRKLSPDILKRVTILPLQTI